MLISLGVLGGVLALATHFALEQQRFFRGVGDVAALRSQVTQAGDLLGGVLWAIVPGTDLRVAQDSAIQIDAGIGAAVSCVSATGDLVVPAPAEAAGHTFTAFARPPAAGDAVHARFTDTLGSTWLRFHVADEPRSQGACVGLDQPRPAWSIRLVEPVVIPLASALRFTRPMRFSIYQSSDGRWYLGARDWNAALGQFNAIQPVAGPLRPYSADPAATGLRFAYHDSAGTELTAPVEPRRVARITVVVRGRTGRPVRIAGLSRPAGTWDDSAVTVVAMRNRR